jgi:hypothetical protein
MDGVSFLDAFSHCLNLPAKGDVSPLRGKWPERPSPIGFCKFLSGID